MSPSMIRTRRPPAAQTVAKLHTVLDFPSDIPPLVTLKQVAPLFLLNRSTLVLQDPVGLAIRQKFAVSGEPPDSFGITPRTGTSRNLVTSSIVFTLVSMCSRKKAKRNSKDEASGDADQQVGQHPRLARSELAQQSPG